MKYTFLFLEEIAVQLIIWIFAFNPLVMKSAYRSGDGLSLMAMQYSISYRCIRLWYDEFHFNINMIFEYLKWMLIYSSPSFYAHTTASRWQHIFLNSIFNIISQPNELDPNNIPSTAMIRTSLSHRLVLSVSVNQFISINILLIILRRVERRELHYYYCLHMTLVYYSFVMQ